MVKWSLWAQEGIRVGGGRGLALQFHAILSLAIRGFVWSASHPGRFGPRKGASRFHSVECYVDPLETVWVIRWEGRSFSPAESWSMVPVISSSWCGHLIDWTVAAAVVVPESCGVEFYLSFIAGSCFILSSTTTRSNNNFFTMYLKLHGDCIEFWATNFLLFRVPSSA